MTRLVHLSDIHVTAPQLDWIRADWFNKRLAAWANYRLLGRGQRFRHADQVLVRLMAELQDRSFDHLGEMAVGTAAAFGRERGEQLGVAVVAVGRVEDRLEEAPRRVARPRRRQVEPERGQDLRGVTLEARPIGRREVAGTALAGGERRGVGGQPRQRVEGGDVAIDQVSHRASLLERGRAAAWTLDVQGEQAREPS